MLSDEEKYAIDYLKVYIERDVMYENRHYKQIETMLNLIKKQSKEIEELTLDLEEMTKLNNHKKENWVHKNILNSYVSKDKIREIFDNYKESSLMGNNTLLEFKNELLEERN